MDIVDVCKKSRKLYDSRSYKEGFSCCEEVLANPEAINEALPEHKSELKELSLISVYSALNVSKLPPKGEELSFICERISKACDYADSIDEIQQIEVDVLKEYDIWKKASVTSQLAELAVNPSVELMKAYNKSKLDYAACSLILTTPTRKNKAVEQYCKDEGIETKEYIKGIKKYQDKFTLDEQKYLEFLTGLDIFALAKKDLEQFAHVNADVAVKAVEKILYTLVVAETLIDGSSVSPPSENLDRFKAQAELVDFRLNAVMYPNGQAISLFSGASRQKEIEKLKKLYSKIKEIEPDFIEPGIPSATPVGPKTQQSGGCYVATAVYGSYDCPEVWTLRRFRDYSLALTWYGRLFIALYYAISPTIVKWFGDTNWFNKMWKGRLDKMVKRLQEEGFENTPYEDKNW